MKVNNDPIKNIDELTKKTIARKENELVNINQIYEKKIDNAKFLGDEKYVKTIDRNNARVIQSSKEQEEKLKNYQESLAEAKRNMDHEEHLSKDESQQKIKNIKRNSEEKFSKIYNNSLQTEQMIEDKSTHVAHLLNDKSRHKKISLEKNAKEELATFSGDLTQSTRQNEENLKKLLENEQAVMARTLTQNKMDTQIRLSESNIKNQRVENEQKRVQEEQIKFVDQHHTDLIKQKQEDFKIRYAKLANEHNEILNNLTDKLKKSSETAIAKNVKEKNSILTLQQDPFYHLETLKPRLEEDNENYYVNLDVPAHEKENVHLVAHGRELRLTLNRKYTNAIEEEADGTKDRTTKSELLSKEMSTTEILNPKKITEKYENGILSFKIAKL
jgi:HSP20 family molecular chaperone IbpA